MEHYYQDDSVTLWHGDCLDVLRSMADCSVDSVVTDPPYNLSFMAKPWDAYEGREDAGFAYWLSGLIDGEGCFTIKAHSRGTHAPMFRLKLRADEAGIIRRIHRSMGVGTVTEHKAREGSAPQISWDVQDKAGCQRLVDLLDKYPLRAKKAVDYWTWREAVCEWTSRPRGNRWHGKADTTRMDALRSRLMENRAYTDVPWSGHEFQDWCRLWAAECLRVLKPGGHLLAFGGTRTWHRLACAVEDAGFEVRDSIAWLYGSGFPKSLDVSKAIDKAAGAEREVVGSKVGLPGYSLAPSKGTGHLKFGGFGGDGDPQREAQITAPATPDAEQWQGWGTALKPAFEPIVVARKPLTGTVAANVLTHGTGALNIDACRIEGGERPHIVADYKPTENSAYEGRMDGSLQGGSRNAGSTTAGRWPANVILDETQADALDEQSGPSQSRIGKPRGAASGDGWGMTATGAEYDDNGGASRFFYVAKADATERPRVNGTAHPTVKPLALMRWLVRLVTPPSGTVLEPFAGSGTTVEACILEGFQCIAIEKGDEYLPLIEARIARRRDPVRAIELNGEDGGLFDFIDGEATA